jgi:hypothetical protein
VDEVWELPNRRGLTESEYTTAWYVAWRAAQSREVQVTRTDVQGQTTATRHSLRATETSAARLGMLSDAVRAQCVRPSTHHSAQPHGLDSNHPLFIHSIWWASHKTVKQYKHCGRSQGLTAVVWHITSCSPAKVSRRFGVTYHLQRFATYFHTGVLLSLYYLEEESRYVPPKLRLTFYELYSFMSHMVELFITNSRFDDDTRARLFSRNSDYGTVCRVWFIGISASYWEYYRFRLLPWMLSVLTKFET